MHQDKRTIDAYYYPTTVVFLDDHQTFLDSLPLTLDANVICQPFADPQTAMNYINDQYASMKDDNCIQVDDSHADPFYRYKLDIQAIQGKALDKQRFSESSVLVADYAMPGQNGLEVCEAIDNPHVKKILLTGVADEHVAISALNNNIIDYYLKKSAPNVIQQINRLIGDFQQQYFSVVSRMVSQSLKADCELMDDPVVVEYFFGAIERQSIVEYYLHNEPGPASLDFLMLTEAGACYRLLVFTNQDIKIHKEIAADAKAPAPLLELLCTYSMAPQFPTEDGFYHTSLEPQWQRYFYPADRLVGKKGTYLAAFIPEADMYPVARKNADIVSLQQYLQNNGG